MNYSNLISNFTWSYSRITTFEMCPYKFLMTYIKPHPKERLFFSDYGTFIHKLIEKYMLGEASKEEVIHEYLTCFNGEVIGKAPSREIFKTYFEQGLQYLKQIETPIVDELLGIEQKVDFFIADKPFTGIIDMVSRRNNMVVITDNKSRALKPRSKRKKPTLSDKELDSYLRQLYIYSVPIEKLLGELPGQLEFNCYRTQTLIQEPFDIAKYEEAKKWAAKSIETITNNEDWHPNLDYWKCRQLCDLKKQCEYFQMNRG